jgi:hypothetical protein
LRVFQECKKVADSGDEVIQEQGFSIFDTHEPAVAILLLSFCLHATGSPHRNQIFLVGCHQEVRRFVSRQPGLVVHHIKSVSHRGMSRNERHTLTFFGSFLLSRATTLCHQQAFRRADIPGRPGNGGKAGSTGVWWGDLMRGKPFKLRNLWLY